MRWAGGERSLRVCLLWIRALSFLVSPPGRDEWMREWRGELLHHWSEFETGVQKSRAARFDLFLHSMGALPDALCLLRQEWRLDMLMQDLTYAVRTLGARPGFTFVVIFILALGIGANTVVFSVVDAVLFRPLPFPEPERLVAIWDENTQKSMLRQGPAPGNLLDWRDQSRVFDGIGAWYAGEPRTVRDESSAEKVSATIGFYYV